MSTVIDLSHPLDESIPMFPGQPAPTAVELMSRADSAERYSKGTTFLVQRYEFTGSSGTYLDAPFHRYEDGDDLSVLPLARTVNLPGIRLDVSSRVVEGSRAVEVEDISPLDVAGAALLICTGWSKRWDGPTYLDPNPYLSEAAATLLVEQGVGLVGIDSWNIDDTGDSSRPAHTSLLRAGIPIVENLTNLDQLPTTGFRFSAAPLAIRGGSAVPVRAYAIVDSSQE